MTLEVSKFSGWLNAVANCRREGIRCSRRGAEYQEAGGGGQLRRHAACRPFSRLGARARAERTSNMKPMSVTLDVSKLSGWLNADAFCRVERRACDAGRGTLRPGRREGVGWRRRKRHTRGGPDSRLGPRARAVRTWNIHCMSVTLDVSRLSGWLNADAPCRVERRACDA